MVIGHVIDYRGTGGNSYVINDRTKVSLQVSPFYYIQVESVDGIWGSDISYESHPIPNAIGEKSGDVFRRGTTVTVSGKIYGRGLSELDSGAWFLRQMLAEKALRKFVFIPWAYGIQLYVNCRPYQDLVIVETLESNIYRSSFTFGLRADDPRSYKLSDNSLFPTWQE